MRPTSSSVGPGRQPGHVSMAGTSTARQVGDIEYVPTGIYAAPSSSRAGVMRDARPVTPSGKIPTGPSDRRPAATLDAVVDSVTAAGTLKRRTRRRKNKKQIEQHSTFEFVKKTEFNEAVKGGQVSMTGVVDRFVDKHADNLLIYFASKEFLASTGVNRYRAALGLAWHYRLLLYALLGGAITLFVSIYLEYQKLLELEESVDNTTAFQMDARDDYQRLMEDRRISMMHTMHRLPIRRGDAPHTRKRSARSCQCFSHQHEIAQDYHLTGWEVQEAHSLLPRRMRAVANKMTRGSARILSEQAAHIQPLQAMRVFKVAEFVPHSDRPEHTDSDLSSPDYGYCDNAARFASHSCDDFAGGSTWDLMWQWSDRTPQVDQIPLVGPEDEAAAAVLAVHRGPDVEARRVAEIAYQEELTKQARAKGKFYDLQPDYGVLLHARTRYHFVVQIDYQMNYTTDDDLSEAAWTISGSAPWDASGIVAKLTPRLRPKHAEVLTVGTLDFEIPGNRPLLTTVSTRLRLASEAGLMQEAVKVIAFGSMTRSLGESVRLLHYRGGLPIAALTEKRYEYRWDKPQFSWLEDPSLLQENTTVRWAWQGPFNPHEAIEMQSLRQYARTGASMPRPPPEPWHPNRTLINFTEPWYAGHELTLQPNDEIGIECTYEANVPFTVTGGWSKTSEVCLAFIMVSPAGVLGWRGDLVQPWQPGWRQGPQVDGESQQPVAWQRGSMAPESQSWLTGDIAYTASRGPEGHLRTCADINADGVLGDDFDCSDNVRILDYQPNLIPCMAALCTEQECCTTMPPGSSLG